MARGANVASRGAMDGVWKRRVVWRGECFVGQE